MEFKGNICITWQGNPISAWTLAQARQNHPAVRGLVSPINVETLTALLAACPLLIESGFGMVWQAQMRGFPYSVNGQPGFMAYGIRLTPNIREFSLLDAPRPHKLERLLAAPTAYMWLFEFGDQEGPVVRLELDRHQGSPSTERPVQPPSGYQPTVWRKPVVP